MKNQDTEPEHATDLRLRAEESSREPMARSPENLEALSPEAAQRLLHELRLHQIELEMQNEELRRAQVDLDTARARYFDLYDLAPVGYITLRGSGLILEANLTAATLLGVARGALVSQPLSQFILKEDQDTYYLHRKLLFETGEPQACDLRMVRGGGTQLWVHLEATVVQDPSTNAGRASSSGAGPAADGASVSRVMLSDITERKRAGAEKEKLEAQNRQLQKAESLGRMAMAIAHHFNNKLQAVMGNLELAMYDLPSAAEGNGISRFLTQAMLSTRKAAEVSTLMLTYLGQSHGKRELLDLSEACRRSLPMLRAAIPTSVILDADLPAPGPAIRANANQIQQILANLLTNAWEASGDRPGAIRLSVKTVPAAELSTANRFPVDWQPHDPAYVCLEVTDDGCGIAEQNLEKIFDPFFSTKLIGRGTGLAVVLGVVRAHCGGLTVKSEPGRGSVFRCFLPAAAEAVAPKPVAVDQTPNLAGAGLAAGPAPAGTVLVVEDEPAVREMVALALGQFGFPVLTAEDGVEAVKLFRQHREKVSCVLCDMTMPRMNGWETLTALRKLAPGIPVILASGYHEALVMEGHHPELPHAFLNKPYDFEALHHAITRLLLKRTG